VRTWAAYPTLLEFEPRISPFWVSLRAIGSSSAALRSQFDARNTSLRSFAPHVQIIISLELFKNPVDVLHPARVVFAHLQAFPSHTYPRRRIMCQFIPRAPKTHANHCYGRSLAINCTLARQLFNT
jgi:hypothetical protein